MVDAVVTVFLEKLLDALVEESLVVTKFKEQFEKLKGELQIMQSFLKDAVRESRKKENLTLQTFMVSLRDLIFEAEDILADCQIQSNDDEENTKGCLICFSPKKLPFHYHTGKRIKEINEKISVLRENISAYLRVPLFVQTAIAEVPRWSSPVYDHTQVVGLEGDTKKVKEWLFEANHGLLSIGFIGMGGLGKTTAAQKVFNDRDIDAYFDRKMWVSVSQTFTEAEIMRSMLKTLGDSSVGDDCSELLRKINQYLLGKRYLIVMDDVWRVDNTWWLRLYEGLPKDKGSSVIVTTRNELVALKMGVTEAKTHKPKLLDEDDSWLLFCKIAFAAGGGECVYPELEGVGKEIVERCKGLPLAIKAVGGVMLCKSPHLAEWRRILKNFREELEENGNSVMASLQLSYDELPSYLKSCFLCFSLYPEDCIIDKKQLIHWWIGEGFVPVRNVRLATEVGEDCFSGLMNRCLIEVMDKTYSGNVYTCKVHDMVRDLVIKMAENDAFSRSSNSGSRHMSLRNDIDQRRLLTNLKLRALLSTTKTGEVNKVSSSAAEKFCEYRYLRVLDLSKSVFEMHLTDLLDKIGSLHHLTYLGLSNSHLLIQVPQSMQKLSNLQILDVSYCQNLKILPSYIIAFEKLTVLDVSNCGSLEYLPKGLGRLSRLEVLMGFKPARSSQLQGSRMTELKTLTQLRQLELQLSHGDEIGEDEVDVLLDLKLLEFLTINCFDNHGADLEEKLNKLYPPPNLHELSLKFYPGMISPTWLNPISLPILRFLLISSGKLQVMDHRFWGTDGLIWKLEGLLLEFLSNLTMRWSAVYEAMPSLRIMHVQWCPKLESFPIVDFGFKGGDWKTEGQRRYI